MRHKHQWSTRVCPGPGAYNNDTDCTHKHYPAHTIATVHSDNRQTSKTTLLYSCTHTTGSCVQVPQALPTITQTTPTTNRVAQHTQLDREHIQCRNMLATYVCTVMSVI